MYVCARARVCVSACVRDFDVCDVCICMCAVYFLACFHKRVVLNMWLLCTVHEGWQRQLPRGLRHRALRHAIPGLLEKRKKSELWLGSELGSELGLGLGLGLGL